MTETLATDEYPSRAVATPQILKRKDPIVYGDWSWDAPLSQEQTESYQKNGFLVLENLFSAEEVALLKAEATRLRANAAALDSQTLLRESDTREIRSIFHVHEQSALLGRLVSDARLVNIARFLLDDDVYIHQSRLNYKPVFRGRETYWRSDFETLHVEDGIPRMRTLMVSLMLSKIDPANGPTMFMIGSHKHYIGCAGRPSDQTEGHLLARASNGVPDHDNLAILARSGLAMPTGSPGTIVLFDSNIMHGSNSNITPQPRNNAILTYNAVCNQPGLPYASGQAPRPEYMASRESIAVLKPIDAPITHQA